MVVFGSAQADLISGVNIIFCQSAKTVAFNTQGLVAQGTFINLNRSDYFMDSVTFMKNLFDGYCRCYRTLNWHSSYIEDRRNRKNYIIKENRHIIEYDGYQHAVSIDKLYPENTRLAVKYLKSNPHHLIIETESTMSFWRNFTTVVQLMALTLLLFLFTKADCKMKLNT